METQEPLPEYMTKAKVLLSPSEFMKAWRAGRFKEGEEVRLKAPASPGGKKKGKLSDDQVRAIRTSTGKASDIAKQFSLSNAMIYNIKNKKIYKEVKDL